LKRIDAGLREGQGANRLFIEISWTSRNAPEIATPGALKKPGGAWLGRFIPVSVAVVGMMQFFDVPYYTVAWRHLHSRGSAN